MRAPKDANVSVRLTRTVVERLTALEPFMGEPGVEIRRSDVIRAALLRGLDVLEQEHSTRVSKK